MSGPSPFPLPAEVQAFLERHTTLTLATMAPGGHPAAAPLFYALLADGTLVFLSEAHTAHVRHLRHHPPVALAVYQDGQPWDRIQGLQARGEAFPLPDARVPEAWDAYAQRFPFLQSVRGDAAHPLRAALARVGWYGIRLTWVRLIDNTRGFGWKAEWQRTPEGWERVR